MSIDVPEDAVLDAVFFDPQGAASILHQLAQIEAASIRPGLLDDICQKAGIEPQRFARLLSALCGAGITIRYGDSIGLSVARDDALRHASVLRGAAYARHRHRDSNELEITLTPPAHPSRLMEVLPKGGFSWAGLHHTTDSLAELASQARRRFVIASPFVDNEGLDWIESLFDATPARPLVRTLIVRARDETSVTALSERAQRLRARGVSVLKYDIEHDRSLRQLGYESFHAKILLADDDKAYVGSSNMNRYSRDHSLECGVVVRGPGARPISALVDAIISISEAWPSP